MFRGRTCNSAVTYKTLYVLWYCVPGNVRHYSALGHLLQVRGCPAHCQKFIARNSSSVVQGQPDTLTTEMLYSTYSRYHAPAKKFVTATYFYAILVRCTVSFGYNDFTYCDIPRIATLVTSSLPRSSLR